MLWAGADPYTKGLDYPAEEDDPELYGSALGWAAWRGLTDVFKMKSGAPCLIRVLFIGWYL